MAEENNISEVLRLMEVVVQKVDGMASDVRTNTYKLDGVESRLDRVETLLGHLEVDVAEVKGGIGDLKSAVSVLQKDVSSLSGQFNDVGSMSIKDHKRVDALEQRVDILEQKPH